MSSGPDKQENRKEAAKERHSFLLRLPPDLHAELQRWAAAEVRSLNGHIEYLLREAVRKRRSSGEPRD